jgi:hypothetical protein
VGNDLLVAAIVVGTHRCEFESVECALASEGFAAVGRACSVLAERIGNADENGHERIVSEAVVVIEVFVPQTQPEDPLLEEGVE